MNMTYYLCDVIIDPIFSFQTPNTSGPSDGVEITVDVDSLDESDPNAAVPIKCSLCLVSENSLNGETLFKIILKSSNTFHTY